MKKYDLVRRIKERPTGKLWRLETKYVETAEHLISIGLVIHTKVTETMGYYKLTKEGEVWLQQTQKEKNP